MGRVRADGGALLMIMSGIAGIGRGRNVFDSLLHQK